METGFRFLTYSQQVMSSKNAGLTHSTLVKNLRKIKTTEPVLLDVLIFPVFKWNAV